MRVFAPIIFVLLSFLVKAQNIDYARNWVSILAADSLMGRGYVQNGQQRAATLIGNEFKNLNLLPTNWPTFSTFYQQFSVVINTIEIAKGPKYKLGHQWLPSAATTKISGKYKQVPFSEPPPNKTFWLADSSFSASQKKLLFAAAKRYKQPVIDASYTKMTHSLRQEQQGFPQLNWLKTVTVPKKIKLKIDAEVRQHTVANVAAKVDGVVKDSFLLITAHYDHLGAIGSIIFNGANDNASGTALMLDLARYYAAEKPFYSLVFIAFAAEEAGLLGSTHMVENLPIDLRNRIKGVINVDLMGGGSEGIMLVNGQDLPQWVEKFNIANEIAKLTAIKTRPNAPNSDHFPFTQVGIPAIFMYSMGDVTAYHDPLDRPSELPFSRYLDIFKLLTHFIQNFHAIK